MNNVEVLERIGEVTSLLERIRVRKRNWIDHVLREDSWLQDMIKGIVNGKRKKEEKEYEY